MRRVPGSDLRQETLSQALCDNRTVVSRPTVEFQRCFLAKPVTGKAVRRGKQDGGYAKRSGGLWKRDYS